MQSLVSVGREQVAFSSPMDFNLLAELVPAMIIRFDKFLCFSFINQKFRDTFSKSSEEVIGKTLLDLGIDRKSWQDFIIATNRLTEKGQCVDFSFRMPAQIDQAVHYRIHLRLSPEFDSNNRLHSIIGVASDIGPLLTAHLDLEYKDQLLSLMAEMANLLLKEKDGMGLLPGLLQKVGNAVDADKIFLFECQRDHADNDFAVSRINWYKDPALAAQENATVKRVPLLHFFKTYQSLSEGDCVARRISQIKTPFFKDFLLQLAVQSMLIIPVYVDQSMWGFLVTLDCKDERDWSEDEKHFFKTFASSVSSSIARNNYENKLKESEARFKQLSDITPVMIWVSDEMDHNIYVNQTWKSFTGYKDGPDDSYSWESRVHPEDHQMVDEYRQKFKQQVPLLQEYRLRSAEGEYRWVIDHCIPRKSDNGKFLGYIGVILDVHDKKTAQLEVEQQQKQLSAYSERIAGILESISDGFIALDESFRVFLWNTIIEHKTGILSRQAIGKTITELFPKMEKETLALFRESKSTNRTLSQEHFLTAIGRWEEITVYPSLQGLFIYYKDITERKNQESLLALEKDVLELNARPEFPLSGLCYHMLDRLQGIHNDLCFSVVYFEEEGQRAQLMAAAGLSAHYREEVERWKQGEEGGIWSLPVREGELVELVDFDQPGLSEKYQKLMQQHRFTSAAANPVFDSKGKLLAVFSVYSGHPILNHPNAENMMERMVNMLRVLIEHKQTEREVRISNERYELATRASNDAIWDADLESDTIYWSEGFKTLFGYPSGSMHSKDAKWEKAIHPRDYPRVIAAYDAFVSSEKESNWSMEYRFLKSDGSYALVSDKAFSVYDSNGKIVRVVGSIQDITEKRQMEQKILSDQISYQRQMAQAVLDAQEKEREIIGRELHDNVNQILSTSKLYLEVSSQDDAKRTEFVKLGIKNINDAIHEIRKISRSLVPVAISDLGLIDSIQDMIDTVQQTKDYELEFLYDVKVEKLLKETQKLTLFRIIQEQMNNIHKHAQATRIGIFLEIENQMASMIIEDNGIGFDKNQINLNKGVGLTNIQSRAELSNGIMLLDTSRGKGCKLKIQIPIQND